MSKIYETKEEVCPICGSEPCICDEDDEEKAHDCSSCYNEDSDDSDEESCGCGCK